MTGYDDSSTPVLSPLLSTAASIEHAFGTRWSETNQDGMAHLQQIHSARYLVGHEAGRTGEGDALISSKKGLAVSIRTADCLPILMADTTRQAVAAIHAGWRGTAARIVMETISGMNAEFGTSPGDLKVAIGPGIGRCCYHVDADVGRRFGLSGAGCIDLAEENRRQLRESGVPDSQIEVLGFCTFCDPRFHSWRRDKERAGRMISFIRLI